MYGVGKLLALMLKLQSSGTLNLNSAVGAEGRVYLTIPAGGTGKVQVVIQERMLELDAQSENGEEIRTDENVTVVRLLAGEKLLVRKIGSSV